jgi:hypothetical protein
VHTLVSQEEVIWKLEQQITTFNPFTHSRADGKSSGEGITCLYQPKGSLLCSQGASTGPCPEPADSIAHSVSDLILCYFN